MFNLLSVFLNESIPHLFWFGLFWCKTGTFKNGSKVNPLILMVTLRKKLYSESFFFASTASLLMLNKRRFQVLATLASIVMKCIMLTPHTIFTFKWILFFSQRPIFYWLNVILLIIYYQMKKKWRFYANLSCIRCILISYCHFNFHML